MPQSATKPRPDHAKSIAAAAEANRRLRRSRRIAELAAEADKLTDEQLAAIAAIAARLDARSSND